MTMKEINKILEKYYNGETSLEEENMLKEFFSRSDIPEELTIHKAQFDFYESEKHIEILSTDFDEKIISKIENQKITKLNFSRKPVWRLVAGLAAGLLIIFGSYFLINEQFRDNTTSVEFTAEEQEALDQTLIALAKVSKYINLANEKLQKMSIINQSIEKINKVSYYEKYNKYIFNILGDES